MTGMHRRRFVVFNAIGAALWIVAWTSVGCFSGSHIETVYNDATRYDTYRAIAVGALLLAYIGRRVARARRARLGSNHDHQVASNPDRPCARIDPDDVEYLSPEPLPAGFDDRSLRRRVVRLAGVLAVIGLIARSRRA